MRNKQDITVNRALLLQGLSGLSRQDIGKTVILPACRQDPVYFASLKMIFMENLQYKYSDSVMRNKQNRTVPGVDTQCIFFSGNIVIYY
jgi:hypothetical protein